MTRGFLMLETMKKLRNLREDSDLTQQEVAEFLGTSQTMYARYERGANELCLRHLTRLCRLYNVSSDYLLGVQPDPARKWGQPCIDAKKRRKRSTCDESGSKTPE